MANRENSPAETTIPKAQTRAEEMRVAKIAGLHRQIKKLHSMKIRVVIPGSKDKDTDA